ncbi:MAG: hypothetical protein CSB44_03990 [Gammaproteobacteria bacterium]|nr:MAG: hypothetical protein CSB44_03990 [Gammaproteobacteria bacterium]
MRARSATITVTIALLTGMLTVARTPDLRAQSSSDNCAPDATLARSFDSGASWRLCGDIDPLRGLVLSDVRYRAPGDSERDVLASLGLAQLIVDQRGSGQGRAEIGSRLQGNDGLGGDALLPVSDCQGEAIALNDVADALCSDSRLQPMLAKYAETPEITGSRWRLYSEAQRGFARWRIGFDLFEDGRIAPFLLLLEHPALERHEGLALLASWRIVPRLDGELANTLEQFDFPLDTTGSNQRPQRVQHFDTESLAFITREHFSGWRIVGSHGSYYLDPAGSGFDWSGREDNWAGSDLAVTVARDCERLAMHDSGCGDGGATGQSLDTWLDGESLAGQALALWHQQSRVLPGDGVVSVQDYPLGFTLLPFDWTTSSPFEKQ